MLEIAFARYCELPFPAYRFIPGRNPHPTADPKGHSYHPPGVPQHEVTLPKPGEWARSGEYLYGCDLYNHAYWWEAHESWEALWQLTDKRDTQGRFLQGLIQASACHLKLLVGHLDGVVRLRRRSVECLQDAQQHGADPIFMGLNVAAFIGTFQTYYRGAPRRTHDPARYPYLRLHQK